MLKRILQGVALAAALLVCGRAAQAQNFRASGFCTPGSENVVLQGLVQTTPPGVMGAHPGCTVTVYYTGTTTLATIFSNAAGGVLSNPFSGNLTTGYWFFYGPSGVEVDVTVSGAGIVTPFTYGDILIGGGGGGGGGGSPGGNNFDVQVRLGSNFASGVTNQANVGVVGNIFVKPFVADRITYVSPEGKDTNDCLSIGTACADPYTAAEKLPGGLASPPTAGNGEIDIIGTVPPTPFPASAHCGFPWFMGPGDPAYPAPPTCWQRVVTSGFNLRCIGPNGVLPDAHRPSCAENWGGATDSLHPSMWFSDNYGGVHIIDIASTSENVGYKLGIDSNNVRNYVGAFSIEIDGGGAQLGVNGPGCGPVMDVGSPVFWVWVHDAVLAGCGVNEGWSVSAIARASNVVTVTTSSPHDFVVGDQLTLQNVTDPSFNSVNGGTYIVTGIGSSTVQFAQNGPNTSSSGGQVFGGKAAAINLDPGNGIGNGDIYIWNINTICGGIRYTVGSSQGALYVDNIFEEGNGSCINTPIMLFTNLDGFENNTVMNLEGADAINPACFEEADTPYAIPEQIVVINSPNMCGPGLSLGNYPASAVNQNISPLRQNQEGFFNGHVVGRTDSTQRNFGASIARFTNLANTSCSTWTLQGASGATLTCGIAAPNATTLAGHATYTSSVANEVYFYTTSITPSVGDYWVGGAWIRSTAGTGFSGSPTSGVVCNVTAPAGSAVNQFLYGDVNSGDGNWSWQTCLTKVTAVTGAFNVFFAGQFNSTAPIDVFAPIFNYIPAGTMSDNEVYDYAANLKTYDSACPISYACDIRGEGFGVGTLLAIGAQATLTGTGACATITTQSGGAWAGAAKCTGTTGASTVTITPGTTAPNGWNCDVKDETTRANLFQQTSHTTTACTLTVTSVTSNDVFVFSAVAF